MRDFRRSLFRLLFTTFFLLAIAWVCLKVMQNGGNWQGLVDEGKAALEGIGPKLTQFAEDAVKKIQEFAGSIGNK